METEVKADEDPEGKTIVDFVGETLRPPGINLSFSSKFSFFLDVSRQQQPFGSLLHWELFDH